MRDNLGDVLRRLSDPSYARAAAQMDRDRLAKKFRAARIRVKENKKRNGGIYVQETKTK